MKVVHVLRSLEFGGAEKLVLELARKQLETGGIDVSLVCLMPGGALTGEAESLGIGVEVVSIGGVRYLSGISRMSSYLRHSAPDIVHTHNFLAHVHAAPAARMLGIPIIHTKHGRAVESMSWAPALRRYLYQLSEAIVVVSRETGEVFAGRSGIAIGRLTVIHNGIDTEKFSSMRAGDGSQRSRIAGMEKAGEDVVVFGAVSRLDPVKDHETMIKAFAEVARQDPRCLFLIVGEGPMRSHIEKMIVDMSLGGRVIMPGFTDDVPAYISAMSMYMQPSLEEGLSLTLLEAAASGVPVVTTPVGGNPEVIEEGVTGSFVEVGDWTGLAKVMTGFMTDPGPFREMAVRAREKVERSFSLNSMEEAYRGLYRDAAGRGEQG